MKNNDINNGIGNDIDVEELLRDIDKAVEQSEQSDKADAKDTGTAVSSESKDAEDPTVRITSPIGKTSGGYREKIYETYDKLRKEMIYDDDDGGTKKFSQLTEDESSVGRESKYSQEEIDKIDSESEEKAKAFEQAYSDMMESYEEEKKAAKKPKPQKPQKPKVPLKSRISGFFYEFTGKLEAKMPKKKVSEEYTSPEQNQSIIRDFRKENNRTVLRMISTAVLSLLLFYVDMAPVIGGKMLPSVITPPKYNVVYVLFQMQILFFIILINNKAIGNGFAKLFSGHPSPDSVTAVATVAVIIHDAVTALTCPTTVNVYVYNSVCALMFLTGIARDYLVIRTRLSAFRIASSRNGKFVISAIDKSASEHSVFADYAGEMKGDMYCVTKTAFVDGVIGKFESTDATEGSLRFTIPACLAISAIFFIIAVRSGGYDGYHAFTLCLMMCLPLASFTASAYPIAKAQSVLEKSGSAILGAESIDRLAKTGVMSFNDADVFPHAGIKVDNILLYGEHRIDHVIYYASGAFTKMGGPLGKVFSDADGEGVGLCSDIEFTDITDSGFTMIAERREVLVGKATYMRQKGYLTEKNDTDALYESKNGRLMFMAYDGSIAAKFYIRYTMDAEFERLLQKADKVGIYIGIRTFDPNIDDSLLAQYVNLKKYPVKVVKLSLGDTLITESKHTECPAVTRGNGSSKSLLSAIMFGSRIKQLRFVHFITGLVSIGIAVIICALLVASGTFTGTTALYPILFQLLWTVFAVCITNIQLQQ